MVERMPAKTIGKAEAAASLLAAAVLLSMLWQHIPAPVCISLVSGDSMQPAIEPGSLVLGVSTMLSTE